MGDAAFTTLYEEHASSVYTYLWRMTASEADAADALQEAFTGLYARLADGAEIEHPRAYLFAAGRHAALRRLGDAGRAGLVGDIPEEPAESPLGDGEVSVLTHDLCAEVRAAERQLPARQREVLVLREVEELSYADIAPLMGMSENAAAQLAWRARAALRAGLRGTALRSIAADGEGCERARTLLELREDRPLDATDETWVDEHLAECERCTASRAAMLEIGTTYRAALPIVAAPLAAKAALASASASSVAAAGAGAAGGSGSSAFTSLFPVPVGAAAGVVVIVLAIGSYMAGVAPGADADKPLTAPAIAIGEPAAGGKPAASRAIAAARRHAAEAAAERKADQRQAAAARDTSESAAPAERNPKANAKRRGAERDPSDPGSGPIRRASSNDAGELDRPAGARGDQGSATTTAEAPAAVTPDAVRKAGTPAVPATPATPATPAQPQEQGPALPAAPAAPAAPATPAQPGEREEDGEGCEARGNSGQGKGGTKC